MGKRVKRPFLHYPLVEVIWDDAAGLRHGWSAKDEKLEPQLCISVGFLIRANDDHIMIAQDTDAEGQHNGRTQIPRGMVQQMRVLRKADEIKETDTSSN